MQMVFRRLDVRRWNIEETLIEIQIKIACKP